MASDTSVENSSESESLDNRVYIELVRKYLSPLEARWKYVQTVLLWEKPTHSLCYFMTMTTLFCAMASGRFRLLLLLVIMMTSTLLLDDVRVKVWQLLRQGGFGAIDQDADSRDTSVSFSQFCERLAGVWRCFSAWNKKLNKLKTDNSYKFYGILFGLVLAVVSAYQYFPLMKMSYLTACALFFWPVVKHHGMHNRVKKALEPFYMPFVVQWQHSRTKRNRDSVVKVADRESSLDSDEEFTKDFHPIAGDDTAVDHNDTFVDHNDTFVDEVLSMPESLTTDLPVEVRFLEGIISSAVNQDLSLVTRKAEESGGNDVTQFVTGHRTLESRTPSFDGSAVFLDDLQFSSVSQATDTFDFQEGEFMEGLEFPDIEKDSDSESETIHSDRKSQLDKKPKEVITREEKAKLSKDEVNNDATRIPENVMTLSRNTDVSDYEMLEQSDAEGMTLSEGSDVDSATRGLQSVTNYVGKWLGY
ncbi:reticulophagy regulator 3-like isoform X2 [Montipora capricornis]|uniref:reticulophagy regulator 3-like isoform X2 n=1 Tax=Montipora foliosa TaxID=591990 RepID=UPI0035F15E09